MTCGAVFVFQRPAVACCIISWGWKKNDQIEFCVIVYVSFGVYVNVERQRIALWIVLHSLKHGLFELLSKLLEVCVCSE